jgi:hypothetical protein
MDFLTFRDDAIFLLSKTKPNMKFLQKRVGVNSIDQLKLVVDDRLKGIDLDQIDIF